jgi:hypothetical protein
MDDQHMPNKRELIARLQLIHLVLDEMEAIANDPRVSRTVEMSDFKRAIVEIRGKSPLAELVRREGMGVA